MSTQTAQLRRARRLAPIAALAAGLLVTACSGPKSPFDIGTQNETLSLTLGEHTAVVSAPVGPIVLPVGPVIAPQPQEEEPEPEPVPSPSLGPCPDFNQLSPVSGVGLEIAKPPSPGTYEYRATTTDAVGKAKTTFKGDTTWKVTIGKQDPISGGYDVSTEVTTGKVKSTRVLRVLTKPLDVGPASQALGDPAATDLNRQVIDTVNGLAGLGLPRAIPNVGRYGPAGIYLLEQRAGDSVFKPIIPIPLVQTPVDDRNVFTGLGTDGTTFMTFTSTIKKKAIVNACGTKIEAVEVELGGGTIVSLAGLKASVVQFTETLDFGLQYGGIPVADRGKVTGVQAPGAAILPDTVERTFDYTINQIPNPPKLP